MRETSRGNLTVSIHPRRVTLVLLGVVIGLASAHASMHLVSYVLQISSEQMFGLEQFFDMGREANLPTYVSALNLLFAGSLLTLIARHESVRHRKQSWHWWGLAVGFLLMSFDEAAMIHEGLVGTTLTRYFGRGEGVMYYSWYKLYIPLVLLIGLSYMSFLVRLPARYSVRFLLAGAVFLSGAIAFEMVESYLMGRALPGASVSQLFEETGEMLGVVLAIDTLLRYLAENDVDLLILFRQRSTG